MMIVVEGPDNAGKSTLINKLSGELGRSVMVMPGEGPEKYAGEINNRIRNYQRWLRYPGVVIFDRHPCISQPIYGLFRQNTQVEQELIDEFYAAQPFILYCRPAYGVTLEGHVAKDHDTAEHLAAVDANKEKITELYDIWALSHAHLVYRIGDREDRILALIRGYARYGT